MLIEFTGPLHPLDDPLQRAFVTIINIILLSENIAEVHRRLLEQNVDPEYRKLSGYFHWSFGDYSFTLWQRIGYNSPVCFRHKIFEIYFAALARRDRTETVTAVN